MCRWGLRRWRAVVVEWLEVVDVSVDFAHDGCWPVLGYTRVVHVVVG